MSVFTFIGDIHGEMKTYAEILSKIEGKSIQVGDLGVGLPGIKLPVPERDDMEVKHLFIHGNHDNPTECIGQPGYLGRFGSLPGHDLFFVSGGFSIDAHWRIPGLNWWHDEELSYREMAACAEAYKAFQPSMVVAHDFPFGVYPEMIRRKFGDGNFPVYRNRQAEFLQTLFEIHKPKIQIGGHWHSSHEFIYEETRFICLDVNETRYLDIPNRE